MIGGILDCFHRGASGTGMRISNGGSQRDDYVVSLRRRARRYRAQAAKLGGHFAAVILEGGRCELKYLGSSWGPAEAQLDSLLVNPVVNPPGFILSVHLL